MQTSRSVDDLKLLLRDAELLKFVVIDIGLAALSVILPLVLINNPNERAQGLIIGLLITTLINIAGLALFVTVTRERLLNSVQGLTNEVKSFPERFELGEYFSKGTEGLLQVQQMLLDAQTDILAIWSSAKYSSYPTGYFKETLKTRKLTKRIINIAAIPCSDIAIHLKECVDYLDRTYYVRVVLDVHYELAIVDGTEAVLFFPAKEPEEPAFLQKVKRRDAVKSLVRRFEEIWDRDESETERIDLADVKVNEADIELWLRRVKLRLERRHASKLPGMALSQYFTAIEDALLPLEELACGANSHVHSIWTYGEQQVLKTYFDKVMGSERASCDRVIDTMNVRPDDIVAHIRDYWEILKSERYQIRLTTREQIRVGVMIADDEKAAWWVNTAGGRDLWIGNVIEDKALVGRLAAYWAELRDKSSQFVWRRHLLAPTNGELDESKVRVWVTDHYEDHKDVGVYS